MRQALLLLAVTCLHFVTLSQTDSGDLEQYVSTYISGIPGNSGDDFQAPSSTELTSWGNMIDTLLVDDLTTARLIADSLNYQIVEYTDTPSGELHYVVEEKVTLIHYWGMYIFNADPCRSGLVLQAPHPKFDFNTGKEAGFCYTRLSARALFISGTHRCNQSGFSICDGSTSVCQGSSANYQTSDNAHNVQSVFQETTDAINSSLADPVFVQLHGFTKLASDPYVIMSNGTRDTPGTDYVDLIKTELSLADSTLTFEVAHVNLAWTRLIAFSNTQGRLLNVSSDPCDTHLDVSTGKFVHLEQEKTKLRDDSTGWHKVYTALSNVFTCDSSTAEISIQTVDDIRVYPNPTDGNFINVHANNLIGYSLLSLNGQLLKRELFDKRSDIEIDLQKLDNGVYLLNLNMRSGEKTIKILKH